MATPATFILFNFQQKKFPRLQRFLAECQSVSETSLTIGHGMLVEQDDVLAMVAMETREHFPRINNGHHCGSSELNVNSGGTYPLIVYTYWLFRSRCFLVEKNLPGWLALTQKPTSETDSNALSLWPDDFTTNSTLRVSNVIVSRVYLPRETQIS